MPRLSPWTPILDVVGNIIYVTTSGGSAGLTVVEFS
jgi:hypothetical protein